MTDAASARPSIAAQLAASEARSRRQPAEDVDITRGDLAWLRVLTRVFVDGTSAAEGAAAIGAAKAGISSWAAIESMLQMHRCAGIAYRLLSTAEVREACAPPPETLDWLRASYLTALAQAFGDPPLVRRLLDDLASAGVPALVIKGVAVGAWLYDDPVLREHSDVDLVVPEPQAGTVHDVLLRSGYEWAGGPFDHPTPFAGPPLCRGESLGTKAYGSLGGGPTIDLSFDPLRVFWRPRSGDPDPFVGWWARRQSVRAGAVELPILGPEDQFLQLSRHLQFHDYSRVVWFIDILLLLRRHGDRLDWDLVGREAQAHGITGGLYRTLELADRLYGVRAPAPAWRALRPNRLVVSLHRRVWPDASALPRDRRQLTSNPLSPRMLGPRGRRQVFGLALLLLDRNRTRNLGYLVRRAFPSRDWLGAVYGNALPPPRSYLDLLRFHRRILARQRALGRSETASRA
jgi:hypothetical protein